MTGQPMGEEERAVANAMWIANSETLRSWGAFVDHYADALKETNLPGLAIGRICLELQECWVLIRKASDPLTYCFNADQYQQMQNVIEVALPFLDGENTRIERTKMENLDRSILKELRERLRQMQRSAVNKAPPEDNPLDYMTRSPQPDIDIPPGEYRVQVGDAKLTKRLVDQNYPSKN